MALDCLSLARVVIELSKLLMYDVYTLRNDVCRGRACRGRAGVIRVLPDVRKAKTKEDGRIVRTNCLKMSPRHWSKDHWAIRSSSSLNSELLSPRITCSTASHHYYYIKALLPIATCGGPRP